MYSKLLIHILFFYLLSIPNSFAQGSYSQLYKADSLFKEKKYIESFEIYQPILENSKQYSPRMLLKMAYIKEGLGDYTSALYYLNLYYSYNPDTEVLKKMEEIGLKYKLSGYTYTDLDYFISIYHEYYNYILIFLITFSIFYYLFMLITRRNKVGLRPFYFVILLVGIFYLINFSLTPPKGIISKSGVHLMSSPSAGASLLEIVDKGHRVTILSKEDIWYKIKWNESEAYIRENNLIRISE